MNLGQELNNRMNTKPVQSKPANTTIAEDLSGLKTRYSEAIQSIKGKNNAANKPKQFY